MNDKKKQMEAVKKYLKQIKLCDTHITVKLSELDNLKAMTLKITATMKEDVVSSSGSQDKLGDAVAKIVDLEEEINKAIDDYVNLKREIGGLIEQVKDPEQVSVLHKLYFEYKDWRTIGEEMGYTERNAQYIHGNALLAVKALMEKEREHELCS